MFPVSFGHAPPRPMVRQVTTEHSLEIEFGLIGPELVNNRKQSYRSLPIPPRDHFLSFTNRVQHRDPIVITQRRGRPKRREGRQRGGLPEGQSLQAQQLRVEGQADRPMGVQREAVDHTDAANTFAQTPRDHEEVENIGLALGGEVGVSFGVDKVGPQLRNESHLVHCFRVHIEVSRNHELAVQAMQEHPKVGQDARVEGIQADRVLQIHGDQAKSGGRRSMHHTGLYSPSAEVSSFDAIQAKPVSGQYHDPRAVSSLRPRNARHPERLPSQPKGPSRGSMEGFRVPKTMLLDQEDVRVGVRFQKIQQGAPGVHVNGPDRESQFFRAAASGERRGRPFFGLWEPPGRRVWYRLRLNKRGEQKRARALHTPAGSTHAPGVQQGYILGLHPSAHFKNDRIGSST